MVVKTTFQVSRAKFWREKLPQMFFSVFYQFCNFSQNFLAFLVRFFRLGCRNCILSVQGKIERKIISGKKFQLCHHFWTWLEKFQPFGKKFDPGLLKLHFTCPEQHFEGNIFVLKNSIFLSLWDFTRKIFGLLTENTRHVWQNYILCARTKI